MLGVVQLAIPCVLAVAVGKVLKAPEASLLGLLEILFGVAWTWMGSSEAPTPAVIGGGALVLVALAANEALAQLRAAGVTVADEVEDGENGRFGWAYVHGGADGDQSHVASV